MPAWTGEPEEEKFRVFMMKPKKIILILIDTLRADHLGCYGYKRNTSPNIDKFAKDGIKFKWPFAPISYTVPSITSLFTGKYPSNHCTLFSNGAPVKSIETDVFLADILGSEGYETAAFVSSLVIGKVRKVAMTSGFNIYNDDMTSHELNRLTELIRTGAETNEAAFKWLAKNFNTDFFLFVHYFDVHGPYVNQKPYDEFFVNDDYYGKSKFINKVVPEDKALGGIPEYQVLSPKRDEEDNLIDFERDINYYIAQYDGGIRYCDEQIGNLFNKLRELGIYDDCLIILTSDHGEALGENNVYFYHGLTVTMDQTHVPLIIKPHTDWHPKTHLIGAPVSLVDIMPTILELVGYDFSELDVDGVSILDIEKHTNRRIISEIEPQIAYIDKSFIHLKPRDNLKEKKYFPYLKELCCEEKHFNYRKDANPENNSMALEWTGERYLPFVDPEISGAEIHYEHLHRYAFAAQFVKGKKVLDFASGEGYGSYMLSKEAELVTGVEIDEKVVKHASSTYINDNLEFMQGSILKVPIEGEKMFDAIICFEAIEHVEEHEELMKEVKRLLRDDGIFIVSSPNKKVYTDDPDYHNPFHLKELYFDEFKNLLKNCFTNIFFFGQRIYTASNLWSLTSRETHNYSEFVIKKGDDEFYFSDGNRKVPVYFIAVASNADLNERYNMRSSLVDASNILIEHYKRLINEFNVAVQEKGEQILNLEGKITDFSGQLNEKERQIKEFQAVFQGKDAQISDLWEQITNFSEQVKEKDKQLDDLNVAVQGKDAQISDLWEQITNFSGQVKEKDKQLDDLNGAVQGKDAQISDLGEQITNFSEQVKEKDKQLDDLNGAVQGKDAQISDLKMQMLSWENEINSMQRSSVWQLLMMYHRGFVERVFPQGMRRRRMYDLGLLSLQIISSEGWKIFLRRVKNKIHPPKNDLLRIRKKGEKCNDNDMTVDVIVPIYNAFEDTQKCVESLLSLTAGVAYRIIIINDKSTDPRITYYLEYLKQKNYSDIIIITNESNIGFIKTVNEGMHLSKKNDVVILNSDTIVTYNWLKKLKECAYLDEKIATVTPLSNNATICSVPNFDQYNDIPKGYSIQEFALLIEKISNDLGIKYSKIPVGIGFCLYIKREVINEIGFYDEIFGRGYNEENDFCMRAYERGYYHVVDLSTYIYHKGKASFMSDQTILEEKNSKVLIERYPYYMDFVRDFAERNPLREIQKSIKSRIKPDQNAPIRIGLDAQLLARDRKTGSEVYLSTLLENILRVDENSVYVAFTSANTIDSFYYKNNKFMRKYATDSKDILLDSEPIDVFHRTFQCFSIYDLLILLKAKSSVITLHDLILYHFPSYFNSPREALQYKGLMELSAQVADRIIAISEHNKKDIIRILGIPETKIDVIYHGIDTNKFKKIQDGDRLKEFKKKYNIRRDYILYIGTDFPHKNHKNLILAYKKLIEEIDNVDLILAGPSTSIERRRNIEAAIHDIKDRVILLNYVDDKDIVCLYNSAKLFVYPSVYEGFGLPLLEAMACGVPVVASKATSIPEVVGDAAVLVDSRNVDALCEGMHKVLTDEALRNKLVEKGLKRIKNFQWEETAKKTIETYEKAYKSSERNEKKIDDETINELLNLMHSDENRLILNVTKEILGKRKR